MKVLKTISLIILIIIALFLIVAFFLPSKYKVERGIEINKPVSNVYNYVADFNNFHDWNPWTELEPDHPYNIEGDSAQVGQKYSWEGKLVGSGHMIFTEISQNISIKADIVFLEPEQGEGIVDWNFSKNGNTTKVS